MKRDCLSQNFWTAIERTLPKPVANDHNRQRADFVFVFAERPTDLRRQSDDVEKVSRDRSARNALRVASRNSAEIARFLMSRGEMFKNSVVLLPIEIIRERDRIILSRPRRFIEDHDSLRVRIRQRLQQDGVDNAEDRGVRADAERKRQHSNKSESR